MAHRRNLNAYLGLAALEAVVALTSVFALPSESGSGWLLGYSKSRWLFAAVLFLLAAGFAGLSILVLRDQNRGRQVLTFLEKALTRPVLYWSVITIAFVALLGSGYLALMAFKFTDALVLARLQRLLPLLIWVSLFSLQTLIFLPSFRPRAAQETQRATKLAWWAPSLIALAGLGLMAMFISQSGLGLQPDRTGWDSPGTPLLGTQLLLAWLIALLVWGICALAIARRGGSLRHIDLAVGILIWLAAIILWQSMPMGPTYFSPRPQPPNWAYYPYSDAALNDLVAQNLLIGEGFTPISEKPLYSLFLAGLHSVFGQDYQSIVFAQTLVLALFPTALYALVTRLHHRFSGLILAGAVILRERNAIALSGDISVSHSKLLMTDLPTALALAFFTLLLLKWLRSDRLGGRWPLVLGACLGFIVLVRSQSVLFLPLLLMLIFFAVGKTLKHRSGLAALALLGFVLATLPWLWRNYQATGEFGYSQPLQASYLAKQYSWTPEANDPGFPEGTPVSEYVSLGFARVRDFTLRYPGEVARFISAHFLHNEVSSLLALPMRFDLTDKLVTFYNLRPYWEDAESRLWSECCSLDSYITDTPYWESWDGILPRDALLPLGLNLALIALGLGTAWRRRGLIALIPLAVHLAYNLSTAIARVSGWRLILPVDWVVLLYYFIGLGQLSLWAWSYLSGKVVNEERAVAETENAAAADWRRAHVPQLAAMIIALALLMPLADGLLPARYQSPTPESIAAAWEEAGLVDQASLSLEAFLQQPGASVRAGRALWPRYYAADIGEPGGQWPAFNPLPFARLGFVLAGPRGEQVVIPLSAAPAAFPNAADVLVFGCVEETYFRAAMLVFTDGSSADLPSDQADTWVCAQ